MTGYRYAKFKCAESGIPRTSSFSNRIPIQSKKEQRIRECSMLAIDQSSPARWV